ncbi:hypothetical protein [Bullifex porci]|uniref:hypothetical protein n=1 Tax=Bullifex porci TaxID=2606638 RepID=UPI0023F327F5|nr:hypothetical protein [Bullifex porci]MDD7256201.1 hypothetical protein [Bullifex porci]
MEKLFLIVLGILALLFGKAKYDLAKAKKEKTQAISVSLKTTTEHESEKATTVLASKLKESTQSIQQQKTSAPLEGAECSIDETIKTTDESVSVEEQTSKAPPIPTFTNINVSIKSEEKIEPQHQEQILSQLERIRKMRGL